MKEIRNKTYIFVVLLGAISGGLVPTASALGLSVGLSSVTLTVGNSLAGLIFFLCIFVYSNKKKGIKFKSDVFFKMIIPGITLGLVGFCGVNAISLIPTTMVIVLQFQFVWIGVVIDSIYNKKIPDLKTVICVVFVIIGVILGSGIIGTDISKISTLGIILSLGSAFFYALYIFFNDITCTEQSWELRGLGTVAGMVLISLIANLNKLIIITNDSIENIIIFSVLISVLGILGPIILFSIGVPKIGTTMASLLASVELPAAIISSILILGSSIDTLRSFGVILILVALIFQNVNFEKLGVG